MTGRARAAALAALLGIVPSAQGVEPEIVHRPPPCLPAGASGRILVEVPDAPPLPSARVYFAALGAKDERFVVMRPDGEKRLRAVLPAVLAPGTVVTYRVVTLDNEGRATSTAPVRVEATAACPVVLTPEERKMARNLVLGLSTPSQPVVPAGFDCRGIVARISADGELGSFSGCRDGVAPVASVAAVRPLTAALAGGPCDGCTPQDGQLTQGGRGGVGVGPGVIPPGPVSPFRPRTN